MSSNTTIKSKIMLIDENKHMKDYSLTKRLLSAITAATLAFLFGLSLTNSAGFYSVCKALSASKDLKLCDDLSFTNKNEGFFKLGLPLKEAQIGLASALVAIGALCSSNGIAYINRSLKTKMYISSFLYLIGNACITGIGNVFMVYSGKYIIGLGAGITCSVVPLYLSLIAPKESKILFNGLMPIGIVSGIFCGQVSSYFFRSLDSWRNCFFITFFLLIFNLISLAFIQNIKLESNNSDRIGILELLRSKKARRSLVVSIMVHLAQQFSGINGVLIFCETIFKNQKNPGLCTIIALFISLITTIISIFISNRFGRKPLLSLSCFLCSVGLFGLMTNFYPIHSMLLYMIGFNFGLRSIPWAITSEIFPPDYVVAAIQISICANWQANAFVTVMFPIILKIYKELSFCFFFGFMIFSSIFFLTFFKETKGSEPALQ
ncbi:hypothetical protein EDEG_03501 [Edhazardia aedis USNM 41457]|uniref:Major facilitator superfamily (MFS) profile domain-containing protein n=1 Tax=Edhazardia aedis (strain USNM 41457) TaxID=1003232 RepID=J9D2M8_EDHAE|nr:hypothetical protein EDEG_03501 [Edhazardia aedis USNM 41457]|eukprot:EJW02051.1 hypothetical protein EDEG_03501 [Edhazardia aedis USNM 41457]